MSENSTLDPLFTLYVFDMYFGRLFTCLLFELLFVFIAFKLTNQVPNLWERVKVYFAGIFKSGFTTNLYIKLISS